MSVGSRAERFNIVSNDHGRKHKCDFSVLERKFPFWENLVKKNQDCQLKLKFGTLTDSNIQNSMVILAFTVFNWNYPSWANLAQKIKIVNLSWNVVPSLINSNMQNSMVVLILFVLNWNYPFWTNLVQKRTWTNLNLHNSMVPVHFFCFRLPFWANLV